MPSPEDVFTAESEAPLHPSQQYTAAFYDWEVRGRGWQLWPNPVDLEPLFEPFFRGPLTTTAPSFDDGYRPTLLSSLSEWTQHLFGRTDVTKTLSVAATYSDELQDPPEPEWINTPLSEMAITLPSDVSVSTLAMQRLLIALSNLEAAVGFEIIGEPDRITIQATCRTADRSLLVEQITAYVPDAVCKNRDGYLEDIWSADPSHAAAFVDFGLSNEFMLPLACTQGIEVDPLAALYAALSTLAAHELGILQVLFQRADHPWAESVLRSVSDGHGGSFFADAPEMPALAKEKVSSPLFSVVVRVAAQSGSSDAAWKLVRRVGQALTQFARPGSNELIPLEDHGLLDLVGTECILGRHSYRSGMLLNASELASLIHFPAATLRAEKLQRQTTRTKAAPLSRSDDGLLLGTNTHRDQSRPVFLNERDLTQHVHVIGASGTGKSTLLLNMIVQSMERGDGLALLDPHGDLLDEVVARVPEGRQSDVVLFDPADEAYPIGFNVLHAHSEIEKNLIASDLGAAFRRLSTSWGDQMTAVLGNAILAFLESHEGGTLLDLRRFLLDREFRRDFLSTVDDPEIVFFWEHAYPLLHGKPQGPLLTRLDTFLRPRLIRNIVAQKESCLDIGALMNDGGIFLARLAQGAIGEENAHLLGTLLVSKFQQLAIARQATQHDRRRPFTCYVDEFQNFVTPSMAAILAGGRKYGLGLVLAHQDLQQLERSADVASAAISNANTRVCFRLGDYDAKRLEDGFSFFTRRDLQSLALGHALARIGGAENDFSLETSPPPTIDRETSERRYDEIRARTRARFGMPLNGLEVQPQSPTLRHPKQRMAPGRALARYRNDPLAPAARSGANDKSHPPSRRDASVSPGRGGRRHKYLQQLVKQLAEEHGFRATIEEQLSSGGRIDVALKKGDLSIACEVSITTSADHEIANIRKCLGAGFGLVVVLVDKSGQQLLLQKATAKHLTAEELNRLQILLARDLAEFFNKHLETIEPQEQTIRGYRVKVRQKVLNTSQTAERRKAIGEVIARSLAKHRAS